MFEKSGRASPEGASKQDPYSTRRIKRSATKYNPQNSTMNHLAMVGKLKYVSQASKPLSLEFPQIPQLILCLQIRTINIK